MKRLCFLLLSSLALGQGVITSPQQVLKVVSGVTSPVPNATITVCAANAVGIPCTPALVGVLFKDAGLTLPLPNPFTADVNGNYQFAIASGQYTVTTSAFGFLGYSYQLQAGNGVTAVPGVGPILRATDPSFACVGDNITVNDNCWSNLQVAAAGGDFTIYFPKGTYKWANSPSFTTPVNIMCEKGTFFNYTGTGNEITFGDIGTAAGTTFDFHPYRVLGCGHIGGASATQGIFVGFNHWKVEIADNLWYNWGNTTNFAIYCHGNNECIVHHNKYWQDTGAATNWLYAPDAGTPGFGALSVDHNDLNCVANVSGGGAPTQGACGIAIWTATTTGTQIVDNPFISAFAVGIRLDLASTGISVMVARNYIEENSSSVGIQLGNPASSNQVIDSVLIDGNRFSLSGSLTAIGMANVTTKLTNSRFIDNFVRPVASIALVNLNNLTGQTGNCGSGNVDFAGGTKTPTADPADVWTDCNKTIGTNVVRVSNSTSGGSASGFLVHTTTAGGSHGWQSDDGAADAKTWDFIQSTGSSNLCLRAVNDANTAANNVFCATRGTGAAVANITFSTAVVPPVNALGSLPACSASTEGSHVVANNCNAACSVGGTCTAGGTTHCELYCSSTPAYVETGR